MRATVRPPRHVLIPGTQFQAAEMDMYRDPGETRGALTKPITAVATGGAAEDQRRKSVSAGAERYCRAAPYGWNGVSAFSTISSD
jgi:hypothetical protein